MDTVTIIATNIDYFDIIAIVIIELYRNYTITTINLNAFKLSLV